MSDKDVFKGMEFSLFHHPDCKEDEVFMQYVNKEEMERGIKTPWETIRFGNPEPDEHHGQIYPVFVKKQEIIDAGGILVSAKDIEE